MTPTSKPDTLIPPPIGDASLARLREAFDAVIDLPPDERARWIAAHVKDPDERVALERLLHSDAGTSGFFETPASEHVACLVDYTPEDTATVEGLVGTRIGAFRLVRLLGKGGMAAVFLGERQGVDFEQRVAVKLLRRGLYSEIEQRLFQRERRVLAALSHPNIAHLIDGGLTPAGIPYLVMEYVDGVPVTQYARERSLGPDACIELFVTICRAVEAAHRSLVVHRDIKPSNILVSTDGTAKLLDFGIAKLIADDDDVPTAAVFTPEYAAPEQRAGKPVTTATDVYALGVLLHELLVGVRPNASHARRPSTLAAGTGPVPQSALRGDLDNILLRALETEPTRRYSSAGALADDMQRHLEGRPVDAHPPSRWYRTRKFVQRHRGGVTLTAILVLGILSALGTALWQARIAREQAARAVAVRDFMVDLFDAAKAKLKPDERPTPATLVREARRRIENDANVLPTVRADVLSTLGVVSHANGDNKAALDLLEQAMVLKRTLYAPDDIERWSTDVQRANALQGLGRIKETAPILEPLLPVFRASDTPQAVEGLQILAGYQMRSGQIDAAIATARESAEKSTRVFRTGSIEALQTSAYPGMTLTFAARHADAIAELDPIVARWRASAAAKGIEYARVLNNLAVSRQSLGDTAQAEPLLREACDVQREVNATNPMLATCLRNLATSRQQNGRYDEAEEPLREALAIDAGAYPEKSLRRVNSLLALAILDYERGRDADAERNARSAGALCEQPDGANDDICARVHHHLGLLSLRANALDAADREIGLALDQRRRIYGERHLHVAAEYVAQARIALSRSDSGKALALSERALDICRENKAVDGRDGLVASTVHAHALLDAGRATEAKIASSALIEAWNARIQNATPMHFDLLAIHALALDGTDESGAAREEAQRALALPLPVEALDATLRTRLLALFTR